LTRVETLPGSESSGSFVRDRLETVSVTARKLFDVIVHQAYQGPLHPKPQGTATPPEILEACGLDVGEFYVLLTVLTKAGLIRVTNAYPFEEIQLSAEAAEGLHLSVKGDEGLGGAE
jgi:hypothetical protein